MMPCAYIYVLVVVTAVVQLQVARCVYSGVHADNFDKSSQEQPSSSLQVHRRLRKAVNRNISADIVISLKNMKPVDLHDMSNFMTNCPRNSFGVFSKCSGSLNGVSVLTATAAEQTDNMKEDHEVSISRILPANESVQIQFKRYSPNVFSIGEVFINSHGQVISLSKNKLFLSRGELRAMKSNDPIIGKLQYHSSTDAIIKAHGPVLVLNEHFRKSYYHELFDGLVYLLVSMPVMTMYPNTTILMESNYKFEKATRIHPILQLFSIDTSRFTYLRISSKNALVRAPLAFVPQRQLEYPPRIIARRIRRKVASLVDWNHNASFVNVAKAGILVYIDKRGNRFGSELQRTLETVFEQLKIRYAITRRIIKFEGDETFNQTIQKFSSASVCVSISSVLLSNMVYLRNDSSVVEIAPQGQKNSRLRYAVIASHLNFHHYIYNATAGRDAKTLSFSAERFLPELFRIIDEQNIQSK